jgi:hypothetical protein
MDAFVHELMVWLKSTPVAHFMVDTRWGWPTVESLHFLGLSLLIGTVGLFDLRLLGLAKKIPIITLHRLIPYGIAGYFLNVITGFAFVAAEADQYLYNPAFQTKMMFMATAGINVLVFYSTMYRRVAPTGSGYDAPLVAKIIGGTSLVCWVGVMSCGRLITFFRPPFHWCFWC